MLRTTLEFEDGNKSFRKYQIDFTGGTLVVELKRLKWKATLNSQMRFEDGNKSFRKYQIDCFCLRIKTTEMESDP